MTSGDGKVTVFLIAGEESGDQLGMVRQDPTGAELAADLFASGSEEEHRALGLPAAGGQGDQGLNLGHGDALHVEDTTAPEMRWFDDSGERRVLPFVGILSGKHVDVVVKHQRFAGSPLQDRP